eukprot:gene9768-biopygen2197
MLHALWEEGSPKRLSERLSQDAEAGDGDYDAAREDEAVQHIQAPPLLVQGQKDVNIIHGTTATEINSGTIPAQVRPFGNRHRTRLR